MSEPMFCDICGMVFEPYKPQLVVCHLPEGRHSSVVQMCESCEARVLQAVEPKLKDGAHNVQARCRLECLEDPIRNIGYGYVADISQFRLFAYLSEDDAKWVRSLGIHVTPAQSNNPPFMGVEFEQGITAVSPLLLPLGWFTGNVYFKVGVKEDGCHDNRAILDHVVISRIEGMNEVVDEDI